MVLTLKKNSKVFGQKKALRPKKRYERDRTMSFCSFVVLSHAKVTTKGFCDILKNGPGINFSIFELSQPAQTAKVDILLKFGMQVKFSTSN